MNQKEALILIDNLDVGEAKKVRLRAVINKRFRISTKDDLDLNIKKLSKLSRGDLSKINRGLKTAFNAINSRDLIKKEFGIDIGHELQKEETKIEV